jgi:pimeloyl-[acyl-carrier protein] methyl ester esterase
VQITCEELETYVVQQIPREQPVTVIAESFSGPIALALAARSDVNVTAVLLVCSFAGRPLGWLGSLIARLPLQSILRFLIPRWMIRRCLVGRDASDELVLLMRAAISKVEPEVLASRLRMALTDRYCLGPVQCRTRVIAVFSTRDCLVGHSALQSIRRACHTAELRQIDSPHFALQATPELVVKTLSALGVVVR